MALCVGKALGARLIKAKSLIREVSTSAPVSKVFRTFPYFGRAPKAFYERQKTRPNPNIKVWQYGREPGYRNKKHQLVVIPEMIPELVVPDLTDCELKPYVSYRADDVEEGPLTSKDLFYFVYSQKIKDDFQNGQLNENGEPLEPSAAEQLTAEEATKQARKVNADIFTDTESILNDDDWMKKQLKWEYN